MTPELIPYVTMTGCAFAAGFVVAGILHTVEHREWCKIMDRHLDWLRKRLDESDKEEWRL